MANTKVSLKLLVDTKGHKILYAEASKDFVDFLFNLLALPVGTIVRLLTKNSLIGSLGNLYSSIENLNESYLQPNQNKDTLLKPKAAIGATNVPMMLSHETSTKKVFMCGSYHRFVADDPRAVCPQCKYTLSTEVPFVSPQVSNEGSSSEGGYVKGVVTYMVMDNLVVTPMSTTSGITLLNKFNVKEVGSLEEKEVEFGMDEGLKLLKASLETKAVLTSIFLGKKGA